MPRQANSGALWIEPASTGGAAGVGRFVDAGGGDLRLDVVGTAVAELREIGDAFRLTSLSDRYVFEADPAHPGDYVLVRNGTPAVALVDNGSGALVLGPPSRAAAEHRVIVGTSDAVLVTPRHRAGVFLRVGGDYYFH